MHKMRARADPGLVAEFEPEIGNALDRHEPAVSDTAGKVWLRLPEQFGPHRRVDAVGTDQHVDRDPCVVLEPRLDAVAPISKANEAVAEMDPVGRESRGNDS